MYYFAYGVKIHSRPPHYFPTYSVFLSISLSSPWSAWSGVWGSWDSKTKFLKYGHMIYGWNTNLMLIQNHNRSRVWKSKRSELLCPFANTVNMDIFI